MAAPSVTVSGQIFGDFTANTGLNSTRFFGRTMPMGYNAFNLTRAYITTSVRFDPRWSALITADANANPGVVTAVNQTNNQVTTSNLGQLFFLKYAYLQANNPFPAFDTLRMGLVPTPWFAYELGRFWPYSFHSFDVGSKYLGFATSAFGLAAAGGAGRLHYDLNVLDLPTTTINNFPSLVNSSYKLPVSGTRKNLQARIGLDLAPGLEASALYSYYRPIGLDRMDGFIGLIGYRSEYLTLAEEFAKDWVAPTGGNLESRQVWSTFGILGGGALSDSLRKADLVLRYDQVSDPSTRLSGERYAEWIAGIGFRPVPGVTLFLNDTLRTYENGAPNENVVGLHYGLAF